MKKTLEQIISEHPKEIHIFNEDGYLDPSGNLYENLYQYFLDNNMMPYGVAKARTGDPVSWVSEKLEEEMNTRATFFL